MTGPTFFARAGLRARYEQTLMDVVIEAIQLLEDKDLSENEKSLNRKLYQHILATYKARAMRGEDVPDFAPAFDAPNPPMTAEEVPSERKRPDLRWDLVDHHLDPLSVLSFAVECKRLRSPSHGQHFNDEYAVNGIARFVNEGHRYGENMSCGAMIGYWQNMSRRAILVEVNTALTRLSLPVLTFPDDVRSSLHEADQILERTFEMNPYRLRHFWLDMRSNAAVVAAERAELAARVSEAATATGRKDALHGEGKTGSDAEASI